MILSQKYSPAPVTLKLLCNCSCSYSPKQQVTFLTDSSGLLRSFCVWSWFSFFGWGFFPSLLPVFKEESTSVKRLLSFCERLTLFDKAGVKCPKPALTQNESCSSTWSLSHFSLASGKPRSSSWETTAMQTWKLGFNHRWSHKHQLSSLLVNIKRSYLPWVG